MGMCPSIDRARSFFRSVFVLRGIERNRSCDRTRSLRRSRAVVRATRLDPSKDAARSQLRSDSTPRWISGDRNCDRPRCIEESLAIILVIGLDPSRCRRRSCLRSSSVPRLISGDRNCDRRRCLERSLPVVLVTSAYGSQIWLPLGTLSNNRSPVAPADGAAVSFPSPISCSINPPRISFARQESQASPGRRRPHVGEVMPAQRHGAEEQHDIGRASSGGSCAAHMARAALLWHFTPRSLAL